MRDGQLAFAEVGTSTARLSSCGDYRYELGRRWARGPSALFVMLNPSKADATHDDHTIRKCMAYARSWGLGAIGVVNLYALRSTDPCALALADDPIGPLNDDAIHDAAAGARIVIAAWGAHPFARDRARTVAEVLAGMGRPMACLRITKAGHPAHPARLPSALRPVSWPGY